MSNYRTVAIEKEGAVTTVVLNRPEKRNAMNPLMHREMNEVLTEVERDPKTRVLVVTGAPPAFCSGMDLKEYFHEVDDVDAERHINRRIANEWCDRMLRMFPKPTIAMVNGHCFGGAFTDRRFLRFRPGVGRRGVRAERGQLGQPARRAGIQGRRHPDALPRRPLLRHDRQDLRRTARRRGAAGQRVGAGRAPPGRGHGRWPSTWRPWTRRRCAPPRKRSSRSWTCPTTRPTGSS